MRFRLVCRYSPGERLFRVGRVMWDRGVVGSGGWSRKLSLGISGYWFHWSRHHDEWLVIVLGVRVHCVKSLGGWFV